MPDEQEPNTVTIMVPSKDPEKEEDLTPKHSKGKLILDEKDDQEIVSDSLPRFAEHAPAPYYIIADSLVRGRPPTED